MVQLITRTLPQTHARQHIISAIIELYELHVLYKRVLVTCGTSFRLNTKRKKNLGYAKLFGPLHFRRKGYKAVSERLLNPKLCRPEYPRQFIFVQLALANIVSFAHPVLTFQHRPS